MDFKPIKTRRIYEEIIEQIKTLLVEGNLKPGDKLLSERELAEKLHVSRASVREALRAIEMMGLIEIRSGEGTFVRESCEDSRIQPLAMVLRMEKTSFLEVYEVRKILESYCAYLAAERATDEELDKMDAIIREMEADTGNSVHGEEADSRFHMFMAEASHNSLLIRLVNTIFDSIKENVRAGRMHLFASSVTTEQLAMQHRRIYEAIKSRDAEGSRQAAIEHLRFAETEMLKFSLDKTAPMVED